jgi:hypothetical protein
MNLFHTFPAHSIFATLYVHASGIWSTFHDVLFHLTERYEGDCADYNSVFQLDEK